MKLRERLELIKSHYIPPFDFEDPVKEVDYVWVDDLLRKKVPNYKGAPYTFSPTGVYRLHLDAKYGIPSLADSIKIIEWDWVDAKKYTGDFFDCENYALWFMSRVHGLFRLNHVGVVLDYTGGHGYNLFVTSEGNVFLFEPQNDQYWLIEDHKYEGMYKLGFAWLLL